MRIDSAILSNAIITASVESPVVSGSAQVNITQTTGYSTFSSSIQTYTDAKVSALVESAPGTLDTLNELAAALGDDANLSASIATTIGDKLATSTHTAFSSSNASALRAEYVASTSALSASAHTRREQISASLDATIDALDSLGISTDTERGALSSSAHTQREAIKGLATSANNSLSSSTATALRSEYVAGDSALSSSAHTQREAIKGLATSANNSLSSSTATALRAEYVAADGAFLTSASIGATINDSAVKLSGIESNATADQTDAEIRTAVEAASNSNVFTDADHSKLNAIEANADVTDATNVTAAGALMDSELTDLAGIKSLDTSTILASGSIGATINDNAVKLAGIESGATADQTASEILTAIKTVDGAGSGLDADTLDGEQGAYYAPSASMKTYVDAKVAGVVDTAPAALNTLNELAAALGDDANFATTTATSIGEKLAIASNLSDLNNAATARTNLGVDAAGTVNYSLPEATATVRGGIELFSNTDQSVAANSVSATAGRTYGVQLNSDGQAVVNVPWVDTDTNTNTQLSDAEVRAAVEAASDSNVFTDDDHTKLNGIEANATADQTAAEIRTAVGTGNNGVIPSAGTAGHFLKHDGTFGLPSYTTNTDTDTIDMGDGFKIANSAGTDQFTVTENEEIRFEGSGATSVSFDSATQKVTITSTDTNTDTNDDVSVANLKTRLAGGFSSNAVTIGDSNDVVTIGGSLVSNGDITAFSDESLKKDVVTIEGALDKTKELRGVSFTRKSDDSKSIGVIAQELEKVLPELVITGDDGIKSVNYGQITGLLIEAVKELSAKVDELQK